MEIRLTQGKVAIVDATDYEFLSQFKWYALRPTGNRNHYAARGVYDKVSKKRSVEYMHKVLGGVGHVNGNTLDNRRINLGGVKLSPSGVSKYTGVSWSKSAAKWQVTMSWQGKKKHLGYFDSEKEAAEMYNTWAKVQYGEFATLNEVD